MTLDEMFAAFGRFFDSAPLNGYQPSGFGGLQTPALLSVGGAIASQTTVPVSPRASGETSSAALAPCGVPSWLELCRPIVQHFESCCLVAYPDPVSPLARALQTRGLWAAVLAGKPVPQDLQGMSGAPWTCGWGSTGTDVCEGTIWTQSIADARLDEGLDAAGTTLDRAVRVPLAPAQKAALVSLVYNVGPGRAAGDGDGGRDGIVTLANGQPSTLLRHLNDGDYSGTADQILAWDRGGGKVLPGLVRRRTAERDLFLTGGWSAT